MTGRPGWATRVPSTEARRRYVTCGGCGRSMAWVAFVEHLRICDGARAGPVVPTDAPST